MPVNITLQKFITRFTNEAAISGQYIVNDEGLDTDIWNKRTKQNKMLAFKHENSQQLEVQIRRSVKQLSVIEPTLQILAGKLFRIYDTLLKVHASEVFRAMMPSKMNLKGIFWGRHGVAKRTLVFEVTAEVDVSHVPRQVGLNKFVAGLAYMTTFCVQHIVLDEDSDTTIWKKRNRTKHQTPASQFSCQRLHIDQSQGL